MEVLVAYKQMRGNRGDKLRLPPKWHFAGQGLMTLVVAKTRVSLLHNFLANWSVDVAADILPPFRNPQDLYLKNNFSEDKVTLKSTYAPAHPGVKISSLISSHIVDSSVRIPSPPPEALLLCDQKMQALCDADRTAVEFSGPMSITPVAKAKSASIQEEIIQSGGPRGSRDLHGVLATSPALKKARARASSSNDKEEVTPPIVLTMFQPKVKSDHNTKPPKPAKP